MPLKDVWDSSCLRVYDTWESAGAKWVIQDLAPEDEDTAIQILVENMLKDEPICSFNNFYEDRESVASLIQYWQLCLSQKLSLGCYIEIDGEKSLVAINVCTINTLGERSPDIEIKGFAWQELYRSKRYVQLKCDAFKYLKVDKILQSCGLAVRREYRGHKLATRILTARGALCTSNGLKASSTIFSGDASQKAAARAGFETIAEVSWKELAEYGLKYPKDETRVLKSMVKKYT